jgi:hypothetical protein
MVQVYLGAALGLYLGVRHWLAPVVGVIG